MTQVNEDKQALQAVLNVVQRMTMERAQVLIDLERANLRIADLERELAGLTQQREPDDEPLITHNRPNLREVPKVKG